MAKPSKKATARSTKKKTPAQIAWAKRRETVNAKRRAKRALAKLAKKRLKTITLPPKITTAEVLRLKKQAMKEMAASSTMAAPHSEERRLTAGEIAARSIVMTVQKAKKGTPLSELAGEVLRYTEHSIRSAESDGITKGRREAERVAREDIVCGFMGEMDGVLATGSTTACIISSSTLKAIYSVLREQGYSAVGFLDLRRAS